MTQDLITIEFKEGGYKEKKKEEDLDKIESQSIKQEDLTDEQE